ncbi:hypothetical protein PM082_000875 [Marasmius tenuissimus]|nr:hypothetical protein PM082_000875 [Marasmius tenuissimus]
MNYLSTPAASSSCTRVISGTTPGLLDVTQSQRLLRHPNSKLTFASYDPRTTPAGLQADPLLDSCKDRRVALDVLGTSVVWRPVPRAILDEGVTDEGLFPRVINICGQQVECSQDQWDIYKLDLKYQCHVHLPPALSTITLATPPISGRTSTRAEDTSNLSGKRARLVMENIRPVPPLRPRKKLTQNKKSAPTDSPLGINRLSLSEDDDEKDESEVEEMIVDAAPPLRAKSAGPSDRTRRLREEISRNRQDRRVRVARRAEKLAQLDEFVPSNLDTTVPPGDAPTLAPEQEDASPDSLVKRKATSLFNPYRDIHYAKTAEEGERNMLYYETTKTANAKRARTVSPTTAKRELGAKRHRREKARQKKREEGIKRRRKRWEDEFLAQLYAEVPELGETTNGSTSNVSEADADNDDDINEDSESEEEEPDSEEIDEDAIREAAIAESRRKLAELEKDRHLWEDEARKRAFRERAEQEAANLRRERMRFAEARQAEVERQRRAEEEEAKRRREMDPRMRQERVRQQREKYRSHQWSSRPWTTQRAVDRYNQLCETFDSTKFCEEEPLVWEAVPWPVLTFPTQIRIGDIEWDAVEKFFDAAQRTMTTQQYRTFVVRSQHRFHPDRWSGRRLLKAVVDDSEREHIETTADRVSKALTPIWEQATRRNQ